jgi:parallel beta-helix repeat protein
MKRYADRPSVRTLTLTLLSLGIIPTGARTVQLPADSSDGLAAAIASAGPGGTVILKNGLHTESGPVTVGFRIDIIGEPGAILETATSADPDYPIDVAAAIHLKNEPYTRVEGIWFRPPAGTIGSCAIVVENSAHAHILGNRVSDFQFGVLVHHGNHSVVSGNGIQVSDAWSLDPSDPAFLVDTEGIVIINGRHVRAANNRVSGGFDGIWLCGEQGYCADNELEGNFIGLVLCRVAAGTYLISGVDAAAVVPATNWLVYRNEAHHNDWGIQVTDGSHGNLLLNNDCQNNQAYDFELTGDTLRYGFPVPGCFNNDVIQSVRLNMVVKDCGADNDVRGNVSLVDTTADPCF